MNVRNVLIDRIDYIRQFSSNSEKNSPAASTVERTQKVIPTREEIQSSVEELNRVANQLNERISFSYNEKINRVIVKVINNETNEVIREIPHKDIIRLVEHIQQYLGVLVDESR